MVANKLDIEELKEVSGGWVDQGEDDAYYVLEDKTAEILDGPFNNPFDAEDRARELGQTPRKIPPEILKYIRNKNNNQ